MHRMDKATLTAAGYPAPGIDMIIDQPDSTGEGEICIKGRCVMMGYFKNSDATRESIDPRGYMHTGDLGRFTEDGFLKITGRKKEIIITAGGENIAPI